ncbi:OmpH family outer membrane protein [Litorimonas sp. WD9-15]|uniref:OmpH family outer membrane protein n=1 Tax=Litorimonas sp. WD9-15 TaxID=3418716 RepID=UPI003D058F88
MFIRNILRVATGFVLALTLSGAAFAQSTILVVDTNKVIQDSLVGQHVARQLETIYTSASSEMKAKRSPLESKAKSLQEQLKTKTSMQEVRSDAALQAQAKALQTDQQKLQVEEYYTANELKITEQKAIGQVSQRIKLIIDQIAQERNADVVLEKSLVIYGGPVDVTDTVISRLNSQMTTVPVTRERLPRKG